LHLVTRAAEFKSPDCARLKRCAVHSQLRLKNPLPRHAHHSIPGEAGSKTNYLQVPVNPFAVFVPLGTVVPVIIPPGAMPLTRVNEAFGTDITLNVPLA
jgi:hypothetical protein